MHEKKGKWCKGAWQATNGERVVYGRNLEKCFTKVCKWRNYKTFNMCWQAYKER